MSQISSVSKHTNSHKQEIVYFHRQELENWTWKVKNVVLPFRVSLKLHVAFTATDLLFSDFNFSARACPQAPVPHINVSLTFPQNNLAAQWPLKGHFLPKDNWHEGSQALFVPTHFPT